MGILQGHNNLGEFLVENNNLKYPCLFHKEINRVVSICILLQVIIIDEFLIV